MNHLYNIKHQWLGRCYDGGANCRHQFNLQRDREKIVVTPALATILHHNNASHFSENLMHLWLGHIFLPE